MGRGVGRADRGAQRAQERERAGWKLHRYQEVDLAFGAACLREREAFYMGWERGLGKTLGTCALIDELGCMATLVVAPDTAKRPVWEAELARFLPHVEAIVLGNTTAQRGRALGHARQLSDAGLPFVLVVHYEALAVIAGKGKTAKGAPRSASAGPSSGSARTCS